MKSLFNILIFFFVIISISIFGQVNTDYDGPKPEVVKGAKSFVFQYTPFQSSLEPVYVGTASLYNDDVTSIDLMGAGFRYFLSNQIAAGIGINFGSSSSTLETESAKYEASITSLGIALNIDYHFKSLYGVSPYIGFNLNYAMISETFDTTPAVVGSTSSKTEYSGNGFGAAGKIGFDWYFTEGLSLGGAYSLGITSLGEPERTSTGSGTSTTDKGSSATSFGISSASVILNVHF